MFFGTQHVYSEAYVQYYAADHPMDYRNDMPHIFQITRRAFELLEPEKPQSMMVRCCLSVRYSQRQQQQQSRLLCPCFRYQGNQEAGKQRQPN